MNENFPNLISQKDENFIKLFDSSKRWGMRYCSIPVVTDNMISIIYKV